MTVVNHTGRKRIGRDYVSVEITEVGDTLPRVTFTVSKLQLDDLPLPGGAQVIVEAYHQNTLERIDAGSVANVRRPVGRSLESFSTSTNVKFRVKVVGIGDQAGVILAVADRLRPTVTDDAAASKSLLEIKADGTLGQLVWRLAIEGDTPVLLVNERVGDWREFSSSPEFTALVLPEAFKRCLEWLAEELPHEAPSDPDESDLARWYFLVLSLGFDALEWKSLEGLDRDEQLNQAVETFSRRHYFMRTLRAQQGGSE